MATFIILHFLIKFRIFLLLLALCQIDVKIVLIFLVIDYNYYLNVYVHSNQCFSF